MRSGKRTCQAICDGQGDFAFSISRIFGGLAFGSSCVAGFVSRPPAVRGFPRRRFALSRECAHLSIEIWGTPFCGVNLDVGHPPWLTLGLLRDNLSTTKRKRL